MNATERRKELTISAQQIALFVQILIILTIVIGSYKAFADLHTKIEVRAAEQTIINNHVIAQLTEMKGDIKTLETSP